MLLLRHSLTLGWCLALSACGKQPSPAPDPLAGLTLDQGKRWVADDHTRKSAQALLEATRRRAQELDVAATKTLGGELQSLLDQLVAGCTMQGPAHSALHVFLEALMPRVQAMRGEDAKAAARSREEVVSLLSRFSTYFE